MFNAQIKQKDCLIRNLYTVQSGQCFFMKIANIWSRLLKHNWWDSFVWKNSCSIRRFYFILYSTKIHFVRLYQSYIARISAHAYVWSAIIIFILSLWIVFSLSEQLKINRSEIIINRFWKKSWFLRNLKKIRIQLKKMNFTNEEYEEL